MELHIKQQSESPAQIVVHKVCRVRKGERVIIVANPDTGSIAQKLFAAVNETGAIPVLIYQNTKTELDSADPSVIAALKTEPDVFFSVSADKLGKDPQAIAEPYKGPDGVPYDHIFDYLMNGKKVMRAIWTPGITDDMFARTVTIDYGELAERCKRLAELYKDATRVHVIAPGGTDVFVPISGRSPMVDNGNFSFPGSGGNIPAGEVFISPVVGNGNRSTTFLTNGIKTVKDSQKNGARLPSGTAGTIVFDGSMTFGDGDLLLDHPIKVTVKAGFVTSVEGNDEARRLQKTITEAERTSIQMEKNGDLPEGQGEIYKRDSRNIGELGIGLNPAATITGNMLEDEKAFHTCHFAIGANYDNDAPALIHLDGVVRMPTIVLTYRDGTTRMLMDKGELSLE